MPRKASRRDWGRIRALPSGRFQARYTDPRTGRVISAPNTFTTRTDASAWLSRRRADIERGDDVDPSLARLPLSSWWPGYRRRVEVESRAATYSQYERSWRLRVEPVFGHTPVSHIRPSQVDAWLVELTATGFSAPEVRRAFGVLARVLDLAVADGALRANPARQHTGRLPKIAEKVRPVLLPAEVAALADAMLRPGDRLAVRLMGFAGLRVGEVLGLQRQDVDVAAGVLHVRRSVTEVNSRLVISPPKNGKPRAIALPPPLVAELRGWLGQVPIHPSALLLPNAVDGYQRPNTWRVHRWRPAVADWNAARAVEPLEVNPHDLRATAASLLIDAGASAKDVQQALGHADIQTTMNVYARVRPGRAADLAERMGRLLLESAGDDPAAAQPLG